MAPPSALAGCLAAFSLTDFTADLELVQQPTPMLHGDADQNLPAEISSVRSHALVPQSELEMVAGAPHGLAATHADAVNEKLLAFLR